MNLTPISDTITGADWQQAESYRLSGTGHVAAGSLDIGAGGYARQRYTNDDGAEEVGNTVRLFITVDENPYENRVVPVYAGKAFTVANHAIRVLAVGGNEVEFQVLPPDEPLVQDPRFERERIDNVIFGDTPRLIPLTDSIYRMNILDTYEGQYTDIDGQSRDGFLGDAQLMEGEQVVEEFTLHRGFERTLPDGSYLRVFTLGERGITLGITQPAAP